VVSLWPGWFIQLAYLGFPWRTHVFSFFTGKTAAVIYLSVNSVPWKYPVYPALQESQDATTASG